jgi:polyhydroxybutyrate depolymerase
MHFTKPCLLIGALFLALLAPAAAQQAASGERSLVSGGLTREYILHIPKDAPPGPKPLVIALHGAWQPAGVMQRYLDLDKVADREGFIVAYPKGLNLLWNDGRATVAGIMPILYPRDDGRFVVDVLESLEAEGLVDPSRAYLMGFSNGGFLTAFVACRYADRFAAYATMMMTVPVGYSESCKPARPLPILMMNGTYDPIVPMFGRPTPGARLMSASESAALFARIDGCGTPVETSAPHARILRWEGCANGSAVAFYEIAGGHQPPSQSTDAADALAALLLGPRRSGLDAPEEVWSFFKRFTLPLPDAPDAAPLLAGTPAVAPGGGEMPARALAMAPTAQPAVMATAARASAPTTAGAARPILQNPDSLATAWQGIAPASETGAEGTGSPVTATTAAPRIASVPLPTPSPLRPRRATSPPAPQSVSLQ